MANVMRSRMHVGNQHSKGANIYEFSQLFFARTIRTRSIDLADDHQTKAQLLLVL